MECFSAIGLVIEELISMHLIVYWGFGDILSPSDLRPLNFNLEIISMSILFCKIKDLHCTMLLMYTLHCTMLLLNL